MRASCSAVSIEEITRYGAELDLYFAPCSLAEIKAKRAGKPAQEVAHNPNPWVIVTKRLDDGTLTTDY